VLRDEFNCRSRWSDAGTAQCAELEFLVADGDSLAGAFKVPSLRNVTARAPYMHAGQMRTLAEVLDHYNRAPAATTGTSELEPLGLSVAELRELTAFLGALGSDPVD
jgi:cytochrome c peroxidase